MNPPSAPFLAPLGRAPPSLGNQKNHIQINDIFGGPTMKNGNDSKQTPLFTTATEPAGLTIPDNQSKKVNLLEVAASETAESSLELVRLGSDETAIVPFTADSEAIELHYCSETEINSYVLCNGPDCVLCRIGRKRDQRLLLPVYLPAAGCVGILPVSRSLRPFALLPQISNVLKAGKPMAMFVTREGAKYNVSTTELPKDEDGGEAAIKHFLDDYEAGLHDLAAVYTRIDNEQLASVEEIARMMSLKGIRVHAGNKRS
jgi:hypothetical protein